MKAAFVGHFAPFSQALDQASSNASNQVQRQIFLELSNLCGRDSTVCYVMAPCPYWPRGPLISRSLNENSIEFIGYLNLPVIKHLVFALRLLVRLFIVRPRLCLQYNSYLFENLALMLFRFCHCGSSLAIIIQDIFVTVGESILSKRWLQSFVQRISLLISKRFDMIVPISSEIIQDFHFIPSKCLVFQGGITEFAIQIMSGQDEQLSEIGVFAGALEPYNGIDRLIDQWLAGDIVHPLHVFGRGSLETYVIRSVKYSDRIIFHGFQPEQVILEWQRKARWNFCLRYSAGLNQKYFFPSKLFNIICAPGAVIVNDFHALPESLRGYLCVIQDDLSDLAVCLAGASALLDANCVRTRREIVRFTHDWRWCISQILQTCFKIQPD